MLEASAEFDALSLHDALPIFNRSGDVRGSCSATAEPATAAPAARRQKRHPRAAARECRQPVRDRKSTRLNSSHVEISYAVFCLKKKTFPRHTIPTCLSPATGL